MKNMFFGMALAVIAWAMIGSFVMFIRWIPIDSPMNGQVASLVILIALGGLCGFLFLNNEGESGG